MLTDT